MSETRLYDPGTRVPGTVYQVVRVIATGGMASVYEVEDTTIGKRYVLKTLLPDLGDRHDLNRRMEEEARALARMQHPNIVDVTTAGVTTDDLKLPYVVMQRLIGQNLRTVLRHKGRLELTHALPIARELLLALSHAHERGIVHRDVKPENVFLHRERDGLTQTKLLDFGIMKLLEGAPSLTGEHFLGTLRYASPEQLRGEGPSPSMDLYAAGLVLYEILAGRGPFDDKGDPKDVAAGHLYEAAPPLSTFVVVPAALEELVHAALDKDKTRRPQTALEFANRIDAIAASFIDLPRAQPRERAASPERHRPRASRLIALSVVALGAIVVIAVAILKR